ncbi:MAG: hypothetical protein ABIN89_25310 [Chitinophagaceae bacterium]
MEKRISRVEVQKLIEKDFAFFTTDNAEDQWLAVFSQRINELIELDFPKLVAILYRLDVSESTLKQLLKDYPKTNAGKIISELIIERQSQKINTREAFRQNNENINESEKW